MLLTINVITPYIQHKTFSAWWFVFLMRIEIYTRQRTATARMTSSPPPWNIHRREEKKIRRKTKKKGAFLDDVQLKMAIMRMMTMTAFPWKTTWFSLNALLLWWEDLLKGLRLSNKYFLYDVSPHNFPVLRSKRASFFLHCHSWSVAQKDAAKCHTEKLCW